MKRIERHKKGFTLVELLIVVAVLAILAAIGMVAYQNSQKRAALATVFKDLKSASEQLGLSYVRSPSSFSSLDSISGDMQSSRDVMLRLVTGYTGPYYENLTPVQNGVLFYEICEELIADPTYSEIHSADGAQTQNVTTRCTDDIGDNVLQITGWYTKKWNTPVTREAIQAFMNGIPYDDWWIDKQEVVRGFYSELIQRFEARGGSFPITSFWEPDANQWWGVPREDLPSPSPPVASRNGNFCVEAYHATYPDDVYRITHDDVIKEGPC